MTSSHGNLSQLPPQSLCLQADDSVSGCVRQQCWSTPPYCSSPTLCIFPHIGHLLFLFCPVTVPASVSPAATLFCMSCAGTQAWIQARALCPSRAQPPNPKHRLSFVGISCSTHPSKSFWDTMLSALQNLSAPLYHSHQVRILPSLAQH